MGYEHDSTRNFIIRQPAFYELLEGSFFEDIAFIWRDKGNRLLATAGIGTADNCGFLDAGELIQDFLDLARIDVDAIDEQHIFLAVGDVVIALLVAIANITGEEPFAAHYFCGFLRLIPITLHDIATPLTEFPDLIGTELEPCVVLDTNFYVWNGQPDGTGLASAIQWVFRDHRAGFAEAVALDERDMKFLFEFLKHLAGKGGSAAHAHPQGQGALKRRMHQTAIKLRYGREDRRLALQNLLHNVPYGVERLNQDN